MRRHALGLIIAIITFAGGFFSAPMSFTTIGTGHGLTEDLKYPCSSGSYYSSHFGRVFMWSCSFDGDKITARDHFVTSVEEYEILSSSDTRVIGRYSIDGFVGYCVLRLDGHRRNDICSDGLRHALAFEKLRFP